MTSNSSEFVVEKSDDNHLFYKAGQVAAAGNSSTEKSYSFTDDKPSSFNQPVYYRLKLVDRDGSFKFSKTFQVVLKGKAIYLLSLSPNPATNFVNAVIRSDKAVRSEVMILSTEGKILSRQTVPLQKGSSTYRIDLPSLSHGMYFLKLVTGDFVQTKTFTAL
jgi:hypothetical protein